MSRGLKLVYISWNAENTRDRLADRYEVLTFQIDIFNTVSLSVNFVVINIPYPSFRDPSLVAVSTYVSAFSSSCFHVEAET